jgi:hypothetical protein
MATITAPDRASRHVTTPIPLPESDMAYGLTVIAIYPTAPIGPAEYAHYAG